MKTVVLSKTNKVCTLTRHMYDSLQYVLGEVVLGKILLSFLYLNFFFLPLASWRKESNGVLEKGSENSKSMHGSFTASSAFYRNSEQIHLFLWKGKWSGKRFFLLCLFLDAPAYNQYFDMRVKRCCGPGLINMLILVFLGRVMNCPYVRQWGKSPFVSCYQCS